MDPQAQSKVRELGLEQCALCAARTALRESHIIPAFVFRYLKDTSITGAMRSSDTPNLRSQDGWKPRMLCGGCEQRFGTWEKQAAERLFVPLHDGVADRFTYGSWFLPFATSVVWRVLQAYVLGDPEMSEMPEVIRPRVHQALKSWRAFLLGEARHTGGFEVHAIPLHLIEGGDVESFPPNINRYFRRVVELDIPGSTETSFVYAKLMRLGLFGVIVERPGEPWKGGKIVRKQGTFGVSHYTVPLPLLDYLGDRARNVTAMHEQMSPRQQGVVDRALEANQHRAPGSQWMRAYSQDAEIFGFPPDRGAT